jgi:hypothetical protein
MSYDVVSGSLVVDATQVRTWLALKADSSCWGDWQGSFGNTAGETPSVGKLISRWEDWGDAGQPEFLVASLKAGKLTLRGLVAEDTYHAIAPLLGAFFRSAAALGGVGRLHVVADGFAYEIGIANKASTFRAVKKLPATIAKEVQAIVNTAAARVAPAKPKPTRGGKAKRKADVSETVVPIVGKVAAAVDSLRALVLAAEPAAVRAAARASKIDVWDAKGKRQTFVSLFTSGKAMQNALTQLDPPELAGETWRWQVPIALAPRLDPVASERALVALTAKAVPTGVRASAAMALGACGTASALHHLSQLVLAPIARTDNWAKAFQARSVHQHAISGLSQAKKEVAGDALRATFRALAEQKKPCTEVGEALLAALIPRKEWLTSRDDLAACFRLARGPESWLGWRALAKAALPGFATPPLPPDLLKLVRGGRETELQPRIDEVQRAFGLKGSPR